MCHVVRQPAAQYFNPRSPHGERQDDFRRDVPCDISIHAPRTGSDRKPSGSREPAGRFQSTLPARGATYCLCIHNVFFAISIHAPRTGSDNTMLKAEFLRAHFNPRSPHGERRRALTSTRFINHFNPRSPHGERQIPVYNARREAVFQSTLPARGATLLVPPDTRRAPISIHAPRTGSDAPNTIRSHLPYTFQSTLPARGATPLR